MAGDCTSSDQECLFPSKQKPVPSEESERFYIHLATLDSVASKSIKHNIELLSSPNTQMESRPVPVFLHFMYSHKINIRKLGLILVLKTNCAGQSSGKFFAKCLCFHLLFRRACGGLTQLSCLLAAD